MKDILFRRALPSSLCLKNSTPLNFKTGSEMAALARVAATA
jgi:hypothetical protein